jgi:hypothetical protein
MWQRLYVQIWQLLKSCQILWARARGRIKFLLFFFDRLTVIISNYSQYYVFLFFKPN